MATLSFHRLKMGKVEIVERWATILCIFSDIRMSGERVMEVQSDMLLQ